jgi:mono/diheme cytochrome c family protein
MRRFKIQRLVVASTAVYISILPFASLSLSAASEQQRSSAAQKAPAKNPIPMSDASVKAGRAVYARICRACHGLQGKGDGVSAPPGSKPANLVDAEWKYGGSDAEIFKTIKEGVKPFDVMEPWGKKLTDTEIWHTVNFLRDLGLKANAKK